MKCGESSRKCTVFLGVQYYILDGECSEAFDVQQGVAQGCSLSPILFSVFINGLLKEVEQAGLGVELAVLLEACYLQMTL